MNQLPLVASVKPPVIPEPESESIAGELQLFTQAYTQNDPNCCGVRHLAGMAGNWTHPRYGELSLKQKYELVKINEFVMKKGVAAYSEAYPNLYEKEVRSWERDLTSFCEKARADRAATLIMHFVRYRGSYSGYVAGVLREVVRARANAVNMGEYVNPNTRNRINGWCIPTSKRDNRLDKENK